MADCACRSFGKGSQWLLKKSTTILYPCINNNGVPAEALAKEGYPIAIIKKEKRAEYIAAIEQARQKEDMNEFFVVIIQAVEYVLDAYLEAVKESGLL